MSTDDVQRSRAARSGMLNTIARTIEIDPAQTIARGGHSRSAAFANERRCRLLLGGATQNTASASSAKIVAMIARSIPDHGLFGARQSASSLVREIATT
jgi:hypothetical protein